MSLLETLEFSSHNEANGDLSEGRSHLEMVTSSKNRGMCAGRRYKSVRSNQEQK